MVKDQNGCLISSHPAIAIKTLPFHPAFGFSSPHLQTILPTILSTGGIEPPSAYFFFSLEDGDVLCCKMSTPPNWKSYQKTIILLHGLGGTDASTYMVRMSRKFYQMGYRSFRLNLRGSGQGLHFAQRPYHGGTSHDILQVVQTLKQQTPQSPILLIGFSLGGNIILKLLGELGGQASSLIEMAIAICAPIDLKQTMELLSKGSNYLYHRYYVRGLQRMGARWIGQHSIRSLVDFDNLVTARYWGYRDAFDYYRQCSSRFILPHIHASCHLIFTVDDPFIDYRSALQNPLSAAVKIWLSQHGGHMGFWGWAGRQHGYNWLDAFLLKLVNNQDLAKENNIKIEGESSIS
jgi:predicted alpha/beta-fold hydrolase